MAQSSADMLQEQEHVLVSANSVDQEAGLLAAAEEVSATSGVWRSRRALVSVVLILAAAVLATAAVGRLGDRSTPEHPEVSLEASVGLSFRHNALDAVKAEDHASSSGRDLALVVDDSKADDEQEAKKSKNCMRASDDSPSLFCWSLLTLGGTEEGLLTGIFKGRAGIFACNDYAVISRKKRLLGEDECGEEVHTWQVDMPKTLPKGMFGVNAETSSFLNVKVFMDCWKALLNSDKIWENDFSVKADSDAVIFPDRIRAQVAPHKGKAVFFTNCRYWGGDTVGKLFGALEVFSKQAMGTYSSKNGTCMSLPWQRWGEDMYMQKCMDAMGVQTVGDFKMTADASCPLGGNPDCSQKDIAAFHPHKDGADWWNCWKKSMA